MNHRTPTRQIVTPNLQKNSFDIPNWWMGTTRIGRITPIRWDDVTPNSHWNIRTNWRCKLAPVIFPFNHKIDGVTVTAFVPYRLIMPAGTDTYPDWEGFIMGDPQDRWGGAGSANQVMPYMIINDSNKGAFTRGGLNNYLGLPPLSTQVVNIADVTINVMPQLAYQMIVDEFFRNPWLQERQCGIGSTYTIDLQSRTHTSASGINTLRYANYDPDYITGILPEAYAGASTDVELDIDVIGSGNAADNIQFLTVAGGTPTQ